MKYSGALYVYIIPELLHGLNKPGIFSVSVLRVYPSEKDKRGNLW